MSTPTTAPPALAPAALRWRCDETSLPFESTDEIKPLGGIIGQDTAVEALRFGLECRAHGQNIFVRGLSGTGRMSLVQRLLEEMKPRCVERFDRTNVSGDTRSVDAFGVKQLPQAFGFV